MRALAYLLGARAMDAARGADTGVRSAKPEEPLEPIATTEETAAAWRRWRERADIDGGARPGRLPRLVPKRA